MKTKTFYYLFLTVFFIIGNGCSKGDEINDLPLATQVGANTFGCKLNGVVYKCSAHWKVGALPSIQGVSGYYHDGKLIVDALIAKNEVHDSRQFNFTFECSANQPGVYRQGLKYQRLSPVEGYDSKIEITRFDKDVISGTFQMKVQFDDDPNGILEFTEGRFDIKRNN